MMEARSSVTNRITAGPGIRTQVIGGVTLLSAKNRAWRWDAAWTVFRGGDDLTVGYGTVNGVEPTEKGVRISGEKGKEQPRIALPKAFDSEGRAWLAVRVEVDEGTGRIPTDSKDKGKPKDGALTVVTTSQAGTLGLSGQTDLVAYWPIAMIAESGRIHQIAYYHLQHARVRPPANAVGGEAEKWLHLFW